MLKQLTRRKKIKFVSNILKRRKYKKLQTGLADHDVLLKAEIVDQDPPAGRSIEVLGCDPDYEAQFVFQSYTPKKGEPDNLKFTGDVITDFAKNNNNYDGVDGGYNSVRFAEIKQVAEFGSNGIDIKVVDEHSRLPKKRKSVRKRAKKGLYRAAVYTWTGLKAVFTGMSAAASAGPLAFNIPTKMNKYAW